MPTFFRDLFSRFARLEFLMERPAWHYLFARNRNGKSGICNGRPGLKTCRVSVYLYSDPSFWGASFRHKTQKPQINGQMLGNAPNRLYGMVFPIYMRDESGRLELKGVEIIDIFEDISNNIQGRKCFRVVSLVKEIGKFSRSTVSRRKIYYCLLRLRVLKSESQVSPVMCWSESSRLPVSKL